MLNAILYGLLLKQNCARVLRLPVPDVVRFTMLEF